MSDAQLPPDVREASDRSAATGEVSTNTAAPPRNNDSRSARGRVSSIDWYLNPYRDSSRKNFSAASRSARTWLIHMYDFTAGVSFLTAIWDRDVDAFVAILAIFPKKLRKGLFKIIFLYYNRDIHRGVSHYTPD